MSLDVFNTYMWMGFEHISDIKGYDHILFMITLCCVYKIENWKKLLVLITAFTIGHSVTLALSALKIFVANSTLIEILIPVTILFSALFNIYYVKNKKEKTSDSIVNKYLIVLVFGFIHGMGFSNFFNAIMGDSMNIVFPLFAFNIGLELGQISIILLFFALHLIINMVSKISQKYWVTGISLASSIASIIMIFERVQL